MKILLVEDSPADQFYCKHIILSTGDDIEVVTAFDGNQALQVLEEMSSPPDLILLDINMPGMNGHEFLQAYSGNQSETPVVMMLTSSDQMDDQEKAMTYKCVRDYLIKPLTVEKVAAIKSFISAS